MPDVTQSASHATHPAPAHPGPQPGLRRECLSFWEVVAQSVANISLVATPAMIIPLVFASGTNGTWLSYLLATMAMLLVTYHVNQFAQRSASPGALYTFVAQGLGASWGAFSGWALVLAYFFTAASVLSGAASYVLVLAQMILGPHVGLPLVLAVVVVVGAIAWWIARRDIQLSTRAMLIAEFASVALILILAAVYLSKAPTRLDPLQFQLHGASAGGIRLGMILAVFSFVGFESATVLGHEAKNPLRAIPRSVLLSVLAAGGFFIFMSYVLVMAFHGQHPALGSSDAPLSVLANLAGIPSFGAAIAVGAALSQSACALASINAASRVLYLMGQHGLLPASMGRLHRVYATPYVGIAVTSSAAIVVPVVILLRHVPVLSVFGDLGSLATYGFLVTYILVAAASPVYLRRRNEPWVLAAWISVAALALMAMPLVGSFYPVPAPPANYLPYVFLSLLVAGVLRLVYLQRSRPELLLGLEAALLIDREGPTRSTTPAA